MNPTRSGPTNRSTARMRRKARTTTGRTPRGLRPRAPGLSSEIGDRVTRGIPSPRPLRAIAPTTGRQARAVPGIEVRAPAHAKSRPSRQGLATPRQARSRLTRRPDEIPHRGSRMGQAPRSRTARPGRVSRPARARSPLSSRFSRRTCRDWPWPTTRPRAHRSRSRSIRPNQAHAPEPRGTPTGG